MNQDQVPIGLIGEENFYQFAFNTQEWTDLLGLAGKRKNASDEVSGCASDSSKMKNIWMMDELFQNLNKILQD